MDNKILKKEIEKNILVATEVADLLKVSRQNIAHLVKTGQLPILRKIPNGYLFFKGDVDEYIMKKNIGFEYETREIYGHGSTYQSLEYFKNNLAHKKNIDSIYIL